MGRWNREVSSRGSGLALAAHLWQCGGSRDRGGSPRDTGSPSAAPGKASGCQKVGAGKDKTAVAFAVLKHSCS